MKINGAWEEAKRKLWVCLLDDSTSYNAYIQSKGQQYKVTIIDNVHMIVVTIITVHENLQPLHFVAKQPLSPCPVKPTQTSCRLLCTVCHSRWSIWEGSSTSQTNIMVTTRPAENQPLASRNDRHSPSSGEAHEHG